MAVSSISQNCIQMTAIGDVLLMRIKVDHIVAIADTDPGEAQVNTGVAVFNADGTVEDSGADGSELWNSGALNANSRAESERKLGWQNGLKVISLPTGGKINVFHDPD